MTGHIQFNNTYRKLPERFYQVLDPEPVSAPKLIEVNMKLAETLGIDSDWLASEAGISMLAGNSVPEGADPIATVYAGHQFGNWNPRLGDGRAVLLGEVEADDGHRYDLQLKGSGPTLFSRGGDGRAPIGPVIREYLISEAMFKLGVPTSRSLAAVTTGDKVYRDEALPGAVLLRVASSHIRFGTFQYFTSIGDIEAVKLLADHVMHRHYPAVVNAANPYRALYAAIVKQTARLVASWQALGFIHGVMNTDNMLVCGETIDYGPCAFMDTYHPETVFSSIDVGGRYAYQNQPGIAHWNLAALAQCFPSLLCDSEQEGVEIARSELDRFPEVFYEIHRNKVAAKLGFTSATEETDDLARDLLSVMTEEKLDYTNTFTDLRLALEDASRVRPELESWFTRWQNAITDSKQAASLMITTNPVIIPRNHQVERVIAAALSNDFDPFHGFQQALSNPFSDDFVQSEFAAPPLEDEIVRQTFCGT